MFAQLLPMLESNGSAVRRVTNRSPRESRPPSVWKLVHYREYRPERLKGSLTDADDDRSGDGR